MRGGLSTVSPELMNVLCVALLAFGGLMGFLLWYVNKQNEDGND